MKANVKGSSRPVVMVSTAVILACGWLGSTVLAGEPVRSEIVKFQDLNLSNPEGVQALYGRIHAAAKRVCSQTDPMFKSAAAVCARKAEAQAVAKVGLPQLVAYYRAQTGDHTQPLIVGR